MRILVVHVGVDLLLEIAEFIFLALGLEELPELAHYRV